MEPDRPDDPAPVRLVHVGRDDRPAQPRLNVRVEREVGEPELEEAVKAIREVGRNDGVDLPGGSGEVPFDERQHEWDRHRRKLEPRGRDGRHVGHGRIIASGPHRRNS
jgi:hypothetical protein